MNENFAFGMINNWKTIKKEGKKANEIRHCNVLNLKGNLGSILNQGERKRYDGM